MRSISLSSYLLPRVRDIIFLSIFSVAMAAGWRTLNSDGDLPRHLLVGQFVIETHSIPRQEMFSTATLGHPLVTHEWLAGVIYFLSYKLLGLGGVVFLTAILISFAFTMLYSALTKDNEDRLLTAFFVLWGAANTYLHWIARPHMFTILFLSIWLVLIDRIARGLKTNIWAALLLMVLWGNIHAEFVAGFLVLIAYMAGWFWDFLFNRQIADPKLIRNLAATFTLSFIASLINPFGLNTWTTIITYVGNKSLMTAIAETKPPDFSDPSFFIEFGLIIVSLLVIALKKRNIQSGHAFLIAGFTVLAMTAARNIHLYGVVAPFVLAGPASEATDSLIQRKVTSALAQIERQLKGYVWPIVIMLAFLAALISGKIGERYIIDPNRFPVHAVDWVEKNPQSGQMFNDFVWGSYIVWRLWPEYYDFTDSQANQSGDVIKMYLSVSDLKPGWEKVFTDYNIEWVIMPVDSILGKQLAGSGWKILYKDSTAIILRRQ